MFVNRCFLTQRLLFWLAVCTFISGFTRAQSASEVSVDCEQRPVATGLREQTLRVGADERTYLIYIPSAYDGVRPLPLLLAFHGFASGAREFVGLTDFNVLAEQEGFIVVYPQAMGDPSLWFVGTGVLLTQDDPRDLMFADALLDHLHAMYCTDARRTYAVGFSLGGGMVHRLACQLSHRIAAISTVAGAFADIPDGCQPTHPIPVLAIHGLADPVVPIEGLGLLFPSASHWLNAWAARNSCNVQTDSSDTGYLNGIAFENCADGVRVELITVPNGGHTWPGTSMPNRAAQLRGLVSQTVKASQLIWDFVSAYQLPD